MLCHIQSGMSQEPLKCKSVTAAIYQIFSCECMTEKMNTRLLDAPLFVIPRNTYTKAVLCELSPVLVREKIIVRFTAANPQILFECSA